MIDEEYYNYQRDIHSRSTVMDLSGGILTDGAYYAYARKSVCSICFECVHSATSTENQCSWDASLTLPRGAKYYIKLEADDQHEAVPVIVECPQFEAQRGRVVLDVLDWNRR